MFEDFAWSFCAPPEDGCITGDGKNFKVCLCFEKSCDDTSTLLSGRTGDQNGFRHIGQVAQYIVTVKISATLG